MEQSISPKNIMAKKKTPKQLTPDTSTPNNPQEWTLQAYLNAAAMKLGTTPETFKMKRLDRKNNLLAIITANGEKHIFSLKNLEKTP